MVSAARLSRAHEGPDPITARPAVRWPLSPFQNLSLTLIFVLLGLPAFVWGVAGESTKLLGLAVMAVAIVHFIVFRTSEIQSTVSSRYTSSMTLFALFLLVCAASAMRAPEDLLPISARIGLAATILLFGIWAALLFMRVSNGLFLSRLRALLLALPLFMAINALLYFIVGAPEGSRVTHYVSAHANELLGWFGIEAPRISNVHAIAGSNNISDAAALALVALTGLWVMDKRKLWRGAYLILGTLSFALLVLGEGRMAMAAGVVTIAVFLIPDRKWLRRACYTALVIGIVSAPLLNFLFSQLDGTALGEVLVRQNDSQNLGTGTGRSFIWMAAMEALQSPSIEHVIGYGFASGDQSGIGDEYSWMFGEDSSGHTFHNAALQWLFDTGYLGLVLFIVVQWKVVGILSRTTVIGETPAKLLMALLLMIYFAGFTEVSSTAYLIEIMMVMLAVNAIAFSTLNFRLARRRPGVVRRTDFSPQRHP